jgi:hypothetical protein
MATEFDVFLSYNSSDYTLVEKLGDRLRAVGLTIWMDKLALRPGLPWQEGLEAGLKASRAVAVCIGAAGLGRWQTPEMRAALDRAQHEEIPVIPVLLPGCPDTPQLALFLAARTWVDLRQGLSDEGLAQLIWGITGIKAEPRGEAEAAGTAAPRWREAQPTPRAPGNPEARVPYRAMQVRLADESVVTVSFSLEIQVRGEDAPRLIASFGSFDRAVESIQPMVEAAVLGEVSKLTYPDLARTTVEVAERIKRSVSQRAKEIGFTVHGFYVTGLTRN